MDEATRAAISAGQIARHKRDREAMKDAPPVTSKRCSKCGEMKRVPEDYFMRKRTLKSGEVRMYPAGECKSCSAERKQRWADSNRAKVRRRQKQWNKKRDAEARRKYQREYGRMKRALEGATPRGPWHRYRHELEDNLMLDSAPLLEEIAGRWRKGKVKLEGDIDKWRVEDAKPTIDSIANKTGIGETTLQAIMRGARGVSVDHAEKILRVFDLEDRLFEVYPELDVESAA